MSLRHNLLSNLPLEIRGTQSDKFSISIGICAYNEEPNIGNLLRALQSQKTKRISIEQVIVVSSGSVDKTDEIVEFFQKNDSRIVLVREPERMGKASAVNLFLKRATGDICVLESADTIPLENTIEELCLPFFNETVGMVGGHPVPVNDQSTFVGFAVHLIWQLHHKVSLTTPKLGEIVAFRNMRELMPNAGSAREAFAAADETFVEAMVQARGYTIKYAPEACVRNKGPETLGDFIEQRKRNHLSHLNVKKMTGYTASTMKSLRLARIALSSIRFSPRAFVWTVGVIASELWARLLASYDFYIRKKSPHIWHPIAATKDLSQ
jgi:biofilm PGA synthesis N-glycosyltransferase PgaC